MKKPVHCLLLLTCLAVLAGCGGSSNSGQPANGALAGNWQFTMAAPADNSYLGGIQGGFLLQKDKSVTGGVVYAVQLPAQAGGVPTLCSGGSAPVTGTFDGTTVNLTVAAGKLTFTLTGTSNGTTMMGTYTSTDGQGCGTAQSNLQWSATLVPPLTGTVQGSFHSAINPSLRDQNFPVTGSFIQGPNIGASNATVTGTLIFQDYPCLTSASVNGQISGNSLILQVIAPNGLNVGRIGAPAGQSNPSPVTIASTTNGMVIQGANGYGVSTKSCPGGNVAGDIGNVCLAFGTATTCNQPITLTPPSLVFLPQLLTSAVTTQTITLTNTDPSNAPITGLSLSFNPQAGGTSLFGLSDFTGLPNFSEQDSCASSQGASFNLDPQQSCTITILFTPQQSCPWLPATGLGGQPPVLCPYPLTASLMVNSTVSADSDTTFAVPIKGTGLSVVVPSDPELDFGAEALGESSPPQTLSFTNSGAGPVQILPALSSPCVNPPSGVLTLPRPLVAGSVAGLQVDTGNISPNGSTINYNCDSDLASMLPNFQISGDTCTGILLAPLASCSLQVSFVPQPSTALVPPLDYFLELNTLQCTSATTADCEIDAGRFPVELKANVPSVLRMTPGAGLDFGTLPVHVISLPQTITIYNDPTDPNAGTINFTGNVGQGNYTEIDTCIGSLAPGASCTVTVTFQPTSIGPNTGAITIGYTGGQIQTIYLRGSGK